MTTTINASTSSGLVQTADTSGILQLQTANTAAVTIDASQNVLIGTTSTLASEKLNVTSGTNAITGLISATNASQSNDIFRINAARNTTNGSYNALAYYNTGASAYRFYVTDNGGAYFNGNVGIGTTAPTAKLTVYNASGFTGAEATYPGTIQINDDVASANALGGLEFKSSVYGSGYGWKFSAIDPGGGVPLTLNYRDNSATWSEGFRFRAGGNLVLAGGVTNATGVGITFPATQSASSDANTLDDYEEGTWTPTVGGTATYSAREGQYVKIGKLVYVRGTCTINSIGTGATLNAIGGLPFTLLSVGINGGAFGSFGYWASLASNVVALYCSADPASTTIYFGSKSTAGGTIDWTTNVWGNSTRIDFNMTYIASA